MAEIGNWVKLGPDGRKEVTKSLPERMQTLSELGKLGPVGS